MTLNYWKLPTLLININARKPNNAPVRYEITTSSSPSAFLTMRMTGPSIDDEIEPGVMVSTYNQHVIVLRKHNEKPSYNFLAFSRLTWTNVPPAAPGTRTSQPWQFMVLPTAFKSRVQSLETWKITLVQPPQIINHAWQQTCSCCVEDPRIGLVS